MDTVGGTIMADGKQIELNPAIFPRVCTLKIESPTKKDESSCMDIGSTPLDAGDIRVILDFPRGVNIRYLEMLDIQKNTVEVSLLEKYAYGIHFTDEDFSELLKLILVPTRRKAIAIANNDLLATFGVTICFDEKKNFRFEIKEEAIEEVRTDTWDCIIIDLLHKEAFEVIDCFDFNENYIRSDEYGEDQEKQIKISLGAWKHSFDADEQSLSSTLRNAFMFTLAGYYCGDRKEQYSDFYDYFSSEFYKRVLLVHAMWSSRGIDEKIVYVPIYDSFYNLQSTNKNKLVEALKTVLDNDDMAEDERKNFQDHLITAAGEFHQQTNAQSILLEQTLIKPAINYLVLREKAKDTLASAIVLCNEHKYSDCANRCFYAMTFSLKALLEHLGKLSIWKPGELKEAETHAKLESAFANLVNNGHIEQRFYNDFLSVKQERWNCDYSLYVFKEPDARACIAKAENFYLEVELLTTT